VPIAMIESVVPFGSFNPTLICHCQAAGGVRTRRGKRFIR
jgi:hypothetical protein